MDGKKMLFRSNSLSSSHLIMSIPRPDIEDDDTDRCPSSNTPKSVLSNNHFYSNFMQGTNSYKLITSDELAVLITSLTFMNHKYDSVIILDGRFPYEFKGGRIKNAQNVSEHSEIPEIYNSLEGGNICIVFHCEFSQNRGPTLMKFFREYDRQQNLKDYPNTKFPNLFLLKGGYRQFYNDHPDLCVGGYVPMRGRNQLLNGQLKRCHSHYIQNMLSAGEMKSLLYSYKKKNPTPTPFYRERSFSQSYNDEFTLSGKRSISLPTIIDSHSQPMIIQGDFSQDESEIPPNIPQKPLTPISIPPNLPFSNKSPLSPSPFLSKQCSEASLMNPDELKSSGFEINFP